MDESFWRDRRILITGHTGFKGAWLALWLEAEGAHVGGLALPACDDTSTFSALSPWSGIHSTIGDIRSSTTVESTFRSIQPEVVFHLAAQPLVRESYANPAETFDVNIGGTAHVLEAARQCEYTRAVLVITTDKVYAPLHPERPFRENDPLGGGPDPYSMSKACVEMLVQSWRTCVRHAPSFSPRFAIATARAGNVIGGGDRSIDRLVPDVFRALEEDRPVRLRYPKAIRPWQHVLDVLRGYLLQAESLLTQQACPPALNFGPNATVLWSAEEVVSELFRICGRGTIEFDDRPQPPESSRLCLDPTLAYDALGWVPLLGLNEALEWTVSWWNAQRSGVEMRNFSVAQIRSLQAKLRN